MYGERVRERERERERESNDEDAFLDAHTYSIEFNIQWLVLALLLLMKHAEHFED